MVMVMAENTRGLLIEFPAQASFLVILVTLGIILLIGRRRAQA